MLRSLMTAVTGVKAHQTMLDVVGNNIANVNTTGYKKDFTVFQDLLYQTIQGATGPGDNRGGVNPSQVGLGVKVAAIETAHTQGPISYTGLSTDMAIQGEGYFVFRDGTSRLYSRAGNFVRDADNTLVHSGTGYTVQGYKMERDPLNPTQFIKGSELVDVAIPMGSKMEARATTLVGLRCNLDSRTKPYLPIGYSDIPFTSFNAKNSQITIAGSTYSMSVETNPTATDGVGYMTYQFDTVPASGGAPLTLVFDMTGIEAGKPQLTFNAADSTTPLEFPGGGPTMLTPAYDNATGMLKFTNSVGGSTLWETNLHENMSYASFTIENKDTTTGGTYNFIAEFDESDLKASPIPLTLWWQDPTVAAPGNPMKKVVVQVPMKTDGTFDLEGLDLTSASVVSGDWPPGYPGTAADPTLKLVSSASGTAIDVQASSNTGSTPIAPLASVGMITQGQVHTTKQTVYDCQGNPYTLEIQFKKLSENRWRWEAFFPNDSQLMPSPSSGEITFGECGKIVNPPFAEIEVPFSLVGTQNSTIKLDFSGESFDLDVMEGITQYASATTTKPYYQDGYTMGVMKDFTVAKDGTVYGVYTNDQSVALYRIALAQFANPMGLEKVGDTMFRETINSGMARIDAAQEDGAGSISASSLEGSNVDLTEEFTRLILAQRGFQANTRVVTTSDQILEEVVNMKR